MQFWLGKVLTAMQYDERIDKLRKIKKSFPVKFNRANF